MTAGTYSHAEAALLEATGAHYTVDTWFGYYEEEDDGNELDEWEQPVYAALDDEELEGTCFDAVADAGQPDWIAFLIEQALKG